MPSADTSADTSPYRPYFRVGYVLALLIVAVCCFEFVRNGIEPTDRDFISLWGAGKLALAGTPFLAYDSAALHAVQEKAATFDGGQVPFPYCPTFLLLVSGFAVLPFPWAMAVWSSVTLCLYAVVARAFAPQSGWLAVAFPPVFVNTAIGQTGGLAAALFIGGLALLARERKFAAGLVLGCLVLKPQLALMLPIAMIAGREWRVIAGAALSLVTTLLAGLVLFGRAASWAWLGQIDRHVQSTRDGVMGWHKLVSIYAAARQLGLSEPTALVFHLVIAVAAALLVTRAWRSEAHPVAKAGVLAAATMLASPYVYLYDSLVLIPAFVLLTQTRTPVALVATLWLMPIIVIVQTAYDTGVVNSGPLLAIALLVMCQAKVRSYRDAKGSSRDVRLDGLRDHAAGYTFAG